MTRNSRRTGERLNSTRNYHTEVKKGSGHWTYCGCMKSIRGVDGWSKLGRNRRKYDKWAGR